MKKNGVVVERCQDCGSYSRKTKWCRLKETYVARKFNCDFFSNVRRKNVKIPTGIKELDNIFRKGIPAEEVANEQ